MSPPPGLSGCLREGRIIQKKELVCGQMVEFQADGHTFISSPLQWLHPKIIQVACLWYSSHEQSVNDVRINHRSL